ncbi:MAG TPA: hypothetical protein VFJ29_05045, partial [Candidatus Kapabacteria bacterium]|nr:hypothetical protein [Candidatus Kapabacteria bacterium]
MKRLYILLAVLFACSGSAFAQGAYAQDKLSAAISAATGYSSDAILFGVTSPTIQSDGSASVWAYSFYCQSKNTVYGVIYAYGIPIDSIQPASNTRTYSPIGTNWKNSTIISVAESNGGSAFRNAHSNPTVYMTLAKGADVQYSSDTVWVVTYQSGSSVLVVFIDAITGQYLPGISNSVNEPFTMPASSQLGQNY